MVIDPDCMFVNRMNFVVEEGAPIAQVHYNLCCIHNCSRHSQMLASDDCWSLATHKSLLNDLKDEQYCSYMGVCNLTLEVQRAFYSFRNMDDVPMQIAR
jgi:hypothetical protein